MIKALYSGPLSLSSDLKYLMGDLGNNCRVINRRRKSFVCVNLLGFGLCESEFSESYFNLN